MTGPQKTLLAIALFVALCLGGFIWFVTQWEAGQASSFTWPDKPRGGAIDAPSVRATMATGWPPVHMVTT